VGDDFREGKLTYPVLLALADATPEETMFWSRTIGDGAQTEHDLATALALVQRHDAIARSLARARDFVAAACAALQTFPESVLREVLIDVAHYTVGRKY
jgi:octaprenyl-diphosphate synthase